MNVLIIGDGNSIHIKNFIEVILKRNSYTKITIFDMNSNKHLNKEAYSFYDLKDILIIKDNGMEKIITNNFVESFPKLKLVLYLLKLNYKLKKIGEFDYCLLHFVDPTKTLLSVINKKRYKEIIPIFWGSDLLRNKKIESKLYDNLFQISSRIVFNTENMKDYFEKKNGDIYKEKSIVIKFPTTSFTKIDELQKVFSKKEIENSFSVPQNKILVMCGHAGNEAEQHEKLIEVLSKCSKESLSECFFIFPMTYGGKNMEVYVKKIERILKKSCLNGRILKEYLSNDEMLKIVINTDIYINVITTDAFSSVMQENLYSGSYLIYGSWLNYKEILDSDIIAQSVDNINDVQLVLEKAILNFNTISTNLENNKKIISSISSPTSIRNTWTKEIFK